MKKIRSLRTIALLGALVVALCAAQEPTLVRLRDAVGDTIDLAERDSFRLFPNTTGFRHAVILAIPGPEFFAEVTLAGTDTSRRVYFRIMPTQLERIRFLIDNREYTARQVRSDSNATLALAAFWREIEGRPLRNIAGQPANVEDITPKPTEAETAGKPANVQDIAPSPTEAETAGKPADVQSITPTRPTEATTAGGPQLQPVSSENRYNYTLHGVTCGSAVGGCIGSWAGLSYVRTENPECSPSYSVYNVEPCVFLGASIGATALGTGAGYALGDNLDRKATPPLPLPKEGKGWRTGCAIGAVVPALILGAAFFVVAGGSHYGKTELSDVIENDPSGLTYLPMALTGLCIAVELTTIGYRIGRAIDRHNAAKAEARRRALGR